MSLFSWNLDNNNPSSRVPSFGPMTTASTSLRTACRAPSVRWLPSMLVHSDTNRSSNVGNGNNKTGSTTTSAFRSNDIYAQQPSVSHPMPSVISQHQEEIMGTNDSPGTPEDASGQSEEGQDDADPGYTPEVETVMSNPDDGSKAMANTGSTNTVSQGGDEDGDEFGRSRKHGKRLTTKEEVSLFQICNRHADTFGHRSKLCEWWMSVTAEFTREQGHPYSWHSVRRKVELVTKQRIKFLDELREKTKNAGSTVLATEDLSNPRWREAVDAWIPTWRRWEDAEARRIEKRDSRIFRKRKRLSAGLATWETGSRGSSTPMPLATDSATTQFSSIQLPPGFDSMFSNTASTTDTNTNNNNSTRQTPRSCPSAATTASTTIDSTTISAILEILSRLNKYLDSRPDSRLSPSTAEPHDKPNNDPPLSLSSSPFSPSSPSSSFHVSPPEPHPQPPSTEKTAESAAVSASIEKMKDDLRVELRKEMEKDRAALEQRLDSVQHTQELILDMLRRGH
ncbi:hypothetical protein MPDQ_005292 [Monascus purpureus]|uniref:Uncharacterized protein n=1 Tax=Monascus purpureus TaxID=5098 RepID=A0A507R048_MONPU|nr:hypothetical protein MPDQ_005292 [Monascus purpureus]